MEQTNLMAICLTAFAAVFFILTLLAITMQLITAAYPHIRKSVSMATIALINSTYQTIIPGSKVTRIEELK